MEIELKLSVRPENAVAVRAHLAQLAGGKPQPAQRMVSTYFDTKDHALLAAGFGLRIRRQGDRSIQTLKGAHQKTGAAAYRQEWEWDVAGEQPDQELLAPIPGMAALMPHLSDVQPVFRTEIDRMIVVVEQAGSTIEMCLDSGAVICGEASEPILELELELKSGDPAVIHHVALALLRHWPLGLGLESKAARGYRMLTGSTPAPERGEPPVLSANLPVWEAFDVLMGGHLHHLLANQPATTAGDPEGLHQMRLAIRCLRGLITAFGAWLEPSAAAQFQSALRRCGRVMGAARDWDVFCLDLLPQALPDPSGPGNDAISEEAAGYRIAAHAELTAFLQERFYNRLVLALNLWQMQRSKDISIGDSAADILTQSMRRMRKFGERAASGEDRHLHRLRKALKKFRYSIEEMKDMFSENDVKPTLKRCRKLQEYLGDFNDAATAEQLAHCLIGDARVDLLPAATKIWAWALARKEAAKIDIEHLWDDLRHTAPFW